MSYITLPLTYTYEVFDNVRVEAGPDVSFLLGAKQINKTNDQKLTNKNTDSFKKIQLGFSVGASYTHEQTGLGGFIRYNGGLSRIGEGGTFYDEKIYNGGISLGVRYRINDLFYRGN